eukprot:gene3643-13722_t
MVAKTLTKKDTKKAKAAAKAAAKASDDATAEATSNAICNDTVADEIPMDDTAAADEVLETPEYAVADEGTGIHDPVVPLEADASDEVSETETHRCKMARVDNLESMDFGLDQSPPPPSHHDKISLDDGFSEKHDPELEVSLEKTRELMAQKNELLMKLERDVSMLIAHFNIVV